MVGTHYVQMSGHNRLEGAAAQIGFALPGTFFVWWVVSECLDTFAEANQSG